jgi:hypothetical protein
VVSLEVTKSDADFIPAGNTNENSPFFANCESFLKYIARERVYWPGWRELR